MPFNKQIVKLAILKLKCLRHLINKLLNSLC